MMKRWKKTAALSALLMTVAAVPAAARDLDEPVTAQPISAPVDVAPILAPEEIGAYMRLMGPVEWVDLEGGYWAVGGMRLIGDNELFKQYEGMEVVVEGREFTGISFYMVPAIEVIRIRPAGEVEALSPLSWDVPANAPLPREIWVNGAPIATNLGSPVVVDGILFVPLRAIAEAAGAEVTWDGALRQVHVRLGDRAAVFRIGGQEAELRLDGPESAEPNRIALAKPVQIIDDRTMIPADAISTVLGLSQVPADEGVMSLVPASQLVLPGPEAIQQEGRYVGRISQVEEGRILLEGPPMANGEPELIWLTITDETKITVGDAVGTAADLQVGAEIVVEVSGPILESYPARAAAASIMVVPAPRADVLTGTIKEIADGRILLEGAPMDSGEPFLAWLAIEENTKILVGDAEGSASDLKVGARVEVEVTGPMLMSYPAQGGAAVIRVLPAE